MGTDNLEVLAEFHAEVKQLGLTATETQVPTELLRQLLASKAGGALRSQPTRELRVLVDATRVGSGSVH